MFANVESQVESLEAAMDPRRWNGELTASYGRQVYETLGPMLREAQTTSSAMARRVEALSKEVGRDAMPREVLERTSELVSRVERACLAHRARCPPQELERRLSREPSFSVASAAAAAADAAAPGAPAASAPASDGAPPRRSSSASSPAPGGTAPSAAAAAPPAPGGSSGDRADTGLRRDSQGQQHVSDSSAACRPLTRSLTLEDVVKETTEREADHRQQQQERVREDAVDPGGGEGEGGHVGEEDQVDVAMTEAGSTDGNRGVAGGAADGAGGKDGDTRANAESRRTSVKNQDLATLAEVEENPEEEKAEGGAPQLGPDPAEGGAVVSTTKPAGRNGGVRVYSFGRGDLGALLHGDDADHIAGEGPVALKDHWSVIQVSTSLFHTMAVTASGDILGCGQNDEGQVRPDLPAATTPFLPRPSLVEPLLSHRVTQVACGLYHTACVTASGVAITWGGNESGQLGHSAEVTRTAHPKAVQVAGAGQAWSSSRRATRVACGDLFTLVLTSRAELFSCGVGDCVGGDGTDRRQAAVVQSLAGFPTVWMACGNSHSVVIGAGGEALAFGLNTHGQLGVGKLAEGEGPAVLIPRPIFGTFSRPMAAPAQTSAAAGNNTPTSTGDSAETSPRTLKRPPPEAAAEGKDDEFLVARAACGQSHTVLVSTRGQAWACGRNRSGQLGLDPDEVAESPTPVRVPLVLEDGSDGGSRSSPVGAIQAAAGRAHTLVLLSDGRVVGFGSDEFGTLGRTAAAALPSSPSFASTTDVSATPSYHWKPAVIEALRDESIASISAGGEQTFALALSEEPGVGQAEPPPTASTEPAASGGAGGSTAGTSTTAMVVEEASPAEKGAAEAKAAAAGDLARRGSEAMFLRRSFSLPAGLKMRTRWAGVFSRVAGIFACFVCVSRMGLHLEGVALYYTHDLSRSVLVAQAVRQTFASPSVLSGCFNVDAPLLVVPRVDAEGLDAVFKGLVGLGPKVAQALWYVERQTRVVRTRQCLFSAAEKFSRGMATVRAGQQPPSAGPSFASSPAATSPSLEAGGVSFLLKYWQAFSFARDSPDASKDEAMESICKTVLALKGHARWWLMRSAKEDYPSGLFSSRLVKPLVAHFAIWVKKEWGRQTPVFPTAALLLKWLHSINELESVAKIPYEDFFSEALSEMSLDALIMDLMRWKSVTPVARKSRFFLCEYSFLISTGTKKALLQAEAEMEQMKAARTGGARFVPGIGVVINPFLVLQVNRSRLLHETLAQVSQIPDSALRKKLKVVFRGEEGVDEGGVAKEFFQLLTVQLFDQSFGMFVPAGKEGRSLWFNKDCVWADEEYGLVGLLVGLAVYSGVILDLPLPLVVFKKVLGEQLSLQDLEDIDPDLLQGFQRLREYDGGDDEDIFGLDFRVTWDDLGMERSHDLLEGGADIPVTADNKEEYLELYAQFLLMNAVSRQFDRFKQGFLRVMSGASTMSLLRAEELEVLVTGTPELDFKQLAEATEYEGGYDKDHPTMLAFWGAVEDMPPEEQKRLLMFVTGSKKAPLGGLGKLSFKIQRAGPDTDHLPTSHTCFNVLMLPEYSDTEKLTRLLKIAITECEGFGLK
ncbi:unnamed protein product [Scytosiphon promiscuus]